MTEPKTKLNRKEYVHFKINTITETNKMCYRKKIEQNSAIEFRLSMMRKI